MHVHNTKLNANLIYMKNKLPNNKQNQKFLEV